ncbi:hypothetical protein X946_5565 [Burkholderia sp. ABCPW 111]|nr:hypothetical protein X946_5565 [Burkholderia sp. ABCPW 111]
MIDEYPSKSSATYSDIPTMTSHGTNVSHRSRTRESALPAPVEYEMQPQPPGCQRLNVRTIFQRPLGIKADMSRHRLAAPTNMKFLSAAYDTLPTRSLLPLAFRRIAVDEVQFRHLNAD